MWKSGKVIGIYIPTLGQEGQRQTDPKNSNRVMPARPAKSVNSILREPVSNKQGREQQRKTTDLTLYPPHTCTHVCMHAYLYTYIYECAHTYVSYNKINVTNYLGLPYFRPLKCEWARDWEHWLTSCFSSSIPSLQTWLPQIPLLSLPYPIPSHPLGLSITPWDIFPVILHKLIYDTISKFICALK